MDKVFATILVGGFGKRLRPLTDSVPKSLIQVAGKPILEWQIEWLKKHGFNEIVLLVGYLKEKIINEFGSGSRLGVKLTYVVEDEPLGTGGAVKNAEIVLSKADFFLVMNGDVLTNLDPKPMIETLLSTDYYAVIASVPLTSPYGVLEIEGSRIRSFVEKPVLRDYWINAGVYVLRPEALRYFPTRGDLEYTAFPEMARENRLGVVRYEGVFWKAIDVYKDLEEASKILEKTKIL